MYVVVVYSNLGCLPCDGNLLDLCGCRVHTVDPKTRLLEYIYIPVQEFSFLNIDDFDECSIGGFALNMAWECFSDTKKLLRQCLSGEHFQFVHVQSNILGCNDLHSGLRWYPQQRYESSSSTLTCDEKYKWHCYWTINVWVVNVRAIL